MIDKTEVPRENHIPSAGELTNVLTEGCDSLNLDREMYCDNKGLV